MSLFPKERRGSWPKRERGHPGNGRWQAATTIVRLEMQEDVELQDPRLNSTGPRAGETGTQGSAPTVSC